MYSLPWPYVNAAPGAEGAGQSRLAGHPTDGPPARSFACVHDGAHVVPSPPSTRWRGVHVGQAVDSRAPQEYLPPQGPPRGVPGPGAVRRVSHWSLWMNADKN